jgi:hypothetical protein
LTFIFYLRGAMPSINKMAAGGSAAGLSSVVARQQMSALGQKRTFANKIEIRKVRMPVLVLIANGGR